MGLGVHTKTFNYIPLKTVLIFQHNDEFECEDSDMRSKIYMLSSDWEVPRISLTLVSSMRWNDSQP